MKIRINRTHFEEVDNIDRIETTSCCVLVHKKTGYPKILKANCLKNKLLVRMVNVGVTSEKIQELRDR